MITAMWLRAWGPSGDVGQDDSLPTAVRAGIDLDHRTPRGRRATALGQSNRRPMEHAPCTSSALSGEAVSELAVRAHELHSTGIHPALQRAAAQPETSVHRSIFPSPTTRCQATECARHVSIMRSICVMQQWVKSLSPKAQSVDRAPPVEGRESLGRLTAPTPPADRRPRAGSATATHTMG